MELLKYWSFFSSISFSLAASDIILFLSISSKSDLGSWEWYGVI